MLLRTAATSTGWEGVAGVAGADDAWPAVSAGGDDPAGWDAAGAEASGAAGVAASRRRKHQAAREETGR